MRAVDFRSFKKPAEVKKFIETMMNEKLRGTGITSSAAIFLIELEPGMVLTNSELAEKVGVTMALSTRVTRQLQDMGLVENEPRGRSCGIHLTPEGERVRTVVKECAERLAGKGLHISYIRQCRLTAVAAPAVCPELVVSIQVVPVEAGYGVVATLSDAERTYMEYKGEMTV